MSALPAAHFYHSADDDGAGVIHEDSPPGLTASGSSDDGSSPSSVGQRNIKMGGGSVVSSSSKAPSEAATAFDAMSPWSSHSSDAIVDTSSAHDWASPFNGATEHHFFDGVGSQSYDSHDAHMSYPSAGSSSSLQQHPFIPSSPGIAAPGNAEAKDELRQASQRMAGGSAERNMGNGAFNPSTSPSRAHSAAMWNPQSQQKPSSDEQMFDSIIEEDSFGPPSTRNSDYAGSPPPRGLASVFGAMHMPSNSASPPGLSSFGVLDGIKVEQQDEAMRPSTAASSSQQQQQQAPAPAPAEATPAINGNEQVEPADDSMAPSAIAGPSSSPHGDTEVAFSASTVVRPEVDGLADLQIHVHGIAARGAKSRVETQIKAHLELVRPSKDDSAGSSAWERIGSFTHLKLPPLSATKRKTKKNQQGTAEIPKEKTLYLDVAVVNASPPHQRAFACQSCSEREKKRADRRKSGRTKSGPLPSEEEMRRLGVDPSSPDAGELAAERLTQEESKRIILFNCGDYLEFKDGHTELPTRVTCYCRHHKEKLGFCILFTMRNWKGKTVACGSTPAIMITDDHKSSAALERSKREAAQQSSSSGGAGAATPAPSSMADRSRANSTDTNVGGDAAGGASRNSKAKKSRPKPYDSSRRSTVSNGAGPSSVAMTPAASNGGGAMSPTTGSSPSMDLVTALAAIGNERALLLQQQHQQQQQQQQQQHQQIATPPPQQSHSHSQPQFQMPMPQQAQHNGINGHHEQQQQQQQQQHTLSSMGTMPFASMLSQGSISPETLLTNPLSLPGIDFNNPAVAQQMLAILGHQALVPGLNLGQPSSSSSPHQGSAPPSLPQARISKIIPGEGPTTGGIEVTILGDNFTDGLTCLFGDLAASSTRVWAANTLICVLPPSPSPGPVAVTLKTAEEMAAPGRASSNNNANAGPLQLFTYVDKSDTQLMELALQVVGFQQTRTMQVPRDIALRLISSGQGSINSSIGQQQQQQQQQQGQGQQQQHGSDATEQLSYARNAVDGLFAAAGEAPTSFQDTMIHFCNVIAEGQHDAARPDAIRLANKNGHTLLHLATMLGFHRLASKLLALGCPVDARDRNGMTALHLAALGGRVAVTRVLLEAGARREVASLTNKVAIDLAREQDAVDVEDLLVHCQMRGQQQQHGLSHAADSSLFDSDYDVDDDNVSTTAGSVVEEREVDWEDDEDSGSESESEGDSDDAQDARQEAATVTPSSTDVKPSTTSQDGPRFLPSTTATEEKSTKQSLLLPPPASATLNEKQQQAQASPLTSNAALRALANKVPGGLAFLGVAGGLQDRLLPHSLQQRISVFHMQTQEQQTPFTDDSGQASGSGEVKAAAANESAPSSATGANGEQDTWRLMSLWRNLVEETGGLWHGRAPPPAYEEAAPNGSGEAAATSDEKPPVVEEEQEQTDVASPPVTPSTTASQLSPTSTPTARRMTRRTSTSSLDSCSTSASSTLATGSPTSRAASTPTQAAAPAARRRIVVEDDWMLRWFWLPCLVLAFLVAAFSTGPLSLAGLASYVPRLGAGGTTAASASAAAVAAADGAREAARAVVGNEGVAAAAAAAANAL